MVLRELRAHSASLLGRSHVLTFLGGAFEQDELIEQQQLQYHQKAGQAPCEELGRRHTKDTVAELISLASKLKGQHAAALAAALAGAEQGALLHESAEPAAFKLAGRSTSELTGQAQLADSPAHQELKEVGAL